MIAIIGAGNAGKALAKAFVRNGKTVVFGVSNVAKYDMLNSFGKVLPVKEAVLQADIVILATPYLGALEVAASISDWKGKTLVDITTPRLPDFSLTVGFTSSGAEQIAKTAKNARVVKAFNTMGAEVMSDPSLVRGKVFMPVCSDAQRAKEEVIKLGNLIGFEAVDAGPLRVARSTEPLAFLWLQLSFNTSKGRTFEFGLLDKKTP